METVYIYNKNLDKFNFNVDKDTEILIFNSSFDEFNINILDNVILKINEFKCNSNNAVINLNIKNNSELIYNFSNILYESSNLIFNIFFNGNNSKSKINIYSIVEGNEHIKLNGVVKNKYKNNELLESVKVLLKDNGKCEVEPDMLISTKEIVANHLVGISPIRQEELNYLMSKCISKESAENLIYKSFILSNINNDELKKKINENL